MTRARQVLIVSGSNGRRAPDSWYERLRAALPAGHDLGALRAPTALAGADDLERSFYEYRPEALPTGQHLGSRETDLMRMGKAWHALLEHAFEPGFVAEAALIGAEYTLDPEQVREVLAATQRVVGSAALARLCGPCASAWSELEMVDPAGDSLRIDRLVELDDAIWILDYKWRCTEAERAGYERQLARYAALVADVHTGRRIRAALVLADGSLIETDPNRAADKIHSGGPPRIEAP